MQDTPELLQNLLKFSEYATRLEKSENIDLTTGIFYTTTIVPLLNFVQEKRIELKRISKNMLLEKVFQNFKMKENVELSSEKFYGVKLQPTKESSDAIDTVNKLRDKNCQLGGESVFKLLVGELIDNIYQHSQFSKAYVLGQRYSKNKFVEVTFFDNGITIPGSYKKQGYTFTDYEALHQATRGFSTKGEERGRGLPYSIGVVTQGLNGEILVASGKAAIYKDKRVPAGSTLSFEFVKEPPFKGTLISIRIPVSTKIIDYVNFV